MIKVNVEGVVGWGW